MTLKPTPHRTTLLACPVLVDYIAEHKSPSALVGATEPMSGIASGAGAVHHRCNVYLPSRRSTFKPGHINGPHLYKTSIDGAMLEASKIASIKSRSLFVREAHILERLLNHLPIDPKYNI